MATDMDGREPSRSFEMSLRLAVWWWVRGSCVKWLGGVVLSELAQPVTSLGDVGLGIGFRVSVSSGCVATGAGWSWQAGGMVRRALALRGWVL